MVQPVDSAQRQIVCSRCMHVNLPMALPQLWCSGCNKQIRSGTHYYKESGERLNIKLCKACYEGIPQGEKPEYLPDVELEQETFTRQLWDQKENQDNDHWVQCDGGCARWFHYICAMFPDAAHLDHSYELELQKFICVDCRDSGVSMEQSAGCSRCSAVAPPRCRAPCRTRSNPTSPTRSELGVTCDGLCVRW